jgi:glycosyltransferase involved in cell wall biosynthesis
LKRRTLLLIAYGFPPFGGAASRRVAKMVKYLDRLGWQTVVVTAPRLIWNRQDPLALGDIPEGTEVIRTRSLEPVSSGEHHPDALLKLRRALNVPLVPSVAVLWGVCALPVVLRACRRFQPDVILCSGPDFTTHLLGAAAKRHTGIPLVVDYRDEWTTHPERSRRIEGSTARQLKNRADRALERHTLELSDHALATTATMVENIRETFSLPDEKISVVTNGYDPDEIPGRAAPDRAPDERLIVHLGSIIRDEQLVPSLLRSLRESAHRRGLTVVLRMIGFVAPRYRESILAAEGPGLRVELLPFRPAQDAIRAAAEADLLLTYLRTPGMERYLNLKIFDYLALRVPTLAVCPAKSETAAIVERCRAGFVLDVDQESPDAFVDRWLDDGLRTSPDAEQIEQHAWPALAARVDEILRQR